MKHTIVDLLIRPGAFFQDAMNEKESLKIPAMIILAGAVLAAVNGYLIGSLSAKMMGDIIPAGTEIFIILPSAILAFLVTLILWLLVAAVFYLISLAFPGQGSFVRVMEVGGYGYLPQILGSLITLVTAIVYIPKITVPVLTKAALENPSTMEATIKAFTHDPAMMELSQITMIISMVFLLWSANIWIFGMQHSRKLSPRDAALCVGIPVVLYILYMVYSITVM